MNEEFSISNLINILLPKLPVIIISTIIMAILSFGYSKFLTEPTYVASGTLYITGDIDSVSGSLKQTTNLSDLMLSQELAKTYGQILSSNTFFKDVAKTSNMNLSYGYIQSLTSITNIEETGILRISVKHSDPEVAYELTNTILNLAPSEIERIVVGGNATVIDSAELPKVPASPNVPRNTLIGAILGFILSVLAIFLVDLFDNTIKSPEDLAVEGEVPILGMIPTIELPETAVQGAVVKS